MYPVVNNESAFACRACLTSNINLYSINEHQLIENFVQLTGTQVFEADGLPQFLCVFCRAMVIKFAQFRNKTQMLQSLLVTILLEQQFITKEHLKIVDRQSYNLCGPCKVEQIHSFELIPTVDGNDEIKYEVINAKNVEPQFVTIEIPKACLINENNFLSLPIITNINRSIIEIKEEENEATSSVYQDSDSADVVINFEPDKIEVEGSKVNKLKVKSKSAELNKSKMVKTTEKQRIAVKAIKYKIKEKIIKQKTKEGTSKINNEIKDKKKKSRSNENSGTKKKIINKSNFETNELWFWFENDKKRGKFEKDYNFKVNILSKEQQLEVMQAKKFNKHYIDSPYKCDLCFRGYLNEHGYKNHMLSHAVRQDSDVVCEICNQRFLLNRSMIKHQMLHRVRLQCNECGYITSNKAQSMQHYRAHQGLKYECKHCEKKFRLMSNYYTHLRYQHPSELLPCDVCGEGFCGEFGLMMHKRKHEINEEVKKKSTDHRCCTCGIQFPSFEAWNVHTQTDIEHSCTTLTKPCLNCGLNFTDVESLRQHTEIHRQLYQCEACNMSFPSEATRNTHYQRKHLNVKRKMFKGDKCYNNFDKKYTGKSMCEICGKKFASEAALLTHQRSHTGDRPFECSVCQKRFQAMINLKTHMLTHTGERPHQCKLCPKAFSKKVTLNIHQRVHTGVRPYTCTCGKSFTQTNSLKLHTMTVHLKQPAPYKSKKRTNNIASEEPSISWQ